MDDLDPAASACMAFLASSSRQQAMDPKHLLQFYNCLNDTESAEAMRSLLAETASDMLQELHSLRPLLIVLVTLVVIGASGNSLLLLLACLRRKRILRRGRPPAGANSATLLTATDWLVTNLAASDFLLSAISQPSNIRRLFFPHRSWEAGLVLCKVVNALTGVNLFVSTFTVTAIAIDRCQAVLRPLSASGPAGRGSRIAIAAIWLAALAAASPAIWFGELTGDLLRLDRAAGTSGFACAEGTAGRLVRELKVAYSGACVCVQYALPLAALLCSAALVRARLARRLAVLAPLRRRRERRRQRRANSLLAGVATLFGVAWLPLSVFNLLQDVRLWRLSEEHQVLASDAASLTGQQSSAADESPGHFSPTMVQALCLISVQAAACANPLLYGLLNENYRGELRRLLMRWRNRSTNRQQSSVSRRLVVLNAAATAPAAPIEQAAVNSV